MPGASVAKTNDMDGTVPGAYFDAVVREYASRYAARDPGGEALRERQRRALELLERPVRRVLDVGCGPGVLAGELIGRGAEVWGVDAAPMMISECRRQLGACERAHFEVGDVTSLAFPDNAFDTVVCLGVIDYIPAYDIAIRELIRVSNRGGTLLISFPNLLSPYAMWKQFVFYPAVRRLRPGYYRLAGRRVPPLRPLVAKRMYTVRDVAGLLARHGAVLDRVAYYHFNVFLSPLDELAPSMALKAVEWLERHRGMAPSWLGAGFIARAIKVGNVR